jgi:hypothetical protein
LQIFKSLLVALSLLCLAASAMAQEAKEWTGSVWSAFMNRAYYQNTGTFATEGPALLVLPEINHKSGFYAGFYIAAPTQSSVGGEFDLRTGWVFNAGPLTLDPRGAWYHFVVPGNVVYDVGNARLTASHRFKLDRHTSIEPYGVIDVQRTLSPTVDTYVALAAGATFKHTLFPEGGGPRLGLNAELWQYVATPVAPENRKPIFSLVGDLGFKLWNEKIEIGPRATLGIGDAVGTGTVRATFGAFLRASF